jgi:hypothetical protein
MDCSVASLRIGSLSAACIELMTKPQKKAVAMMHARAGRMSNSITQAINSGNRIFLADSSKIFKELANGLC